MEKREDKKVAMINCYFKDIDTTLENSEVAEGMTRRAYKGGGGGGGGNTEKGRGERGRDR